MSSPPPPAPEDLALRLAPLRRELAEDLAVIAALPAMARQQEHITALLADVDDTLRHVEAGVVVCLVGSTGAGKSTLINALAGVEIAQPGVHRPTTRYPVVYVPEDLDPERLATWTDDPALGEVRVARYRVDRTAPWAGQVFIDAPDLNFVAVEHRARVAALAATADVLMVVMHRQSITEASPVSFLDDWHDRRQLLFVLNRADELEGEARTALLSQIRELAATRWSLPDAPVFAVSARDAAEDAQAGGLPSLVESLRRLADQAVVAGVRRHRVLGAIGRLSERVDKVRKQVEPDLVALAGELDGAVGSASARIDEDIHRRLAARRVDLQHQLSEEVGKRWHGPGGLLIRAGAVSGLGAGAGALVARRSLLGGAAVAGASLLGDRGAARLRQWRVEGGSELVPTASDLVSWLELDLIGVRERLRRLGLVELELVDPSALAARLGEALSDAWRGFVHRDLPEAAERAGHPLLRWLLDLPLYAAAGWVLWRVAEGYLDGRYEGVPFLVDTAILAAGYALIERTAALAWIRWRARRVEAAAAERFGEAIARERRRVGGALAVELQPLQAALERVATAAERWRAVLG